MAQLVKRMTSNHEILGSNPSASKFFSPPLIFFCPTKSLKFMETWNKYNYTTSSTYIIYWLSFSVLVPLKLVQLNLSSSRVVLSTRSMQVSVVLETYNTFCICLSDMDLVAVPWSGINTGSVCLQSNGCAIQIRAYRSLFTWRASKKGGKKEAKKKKTSTFKKDGGV